MRRLLGREAMRLALVAGRSSSLRRVLGRGAAHDTAVRLYRRLARLHFSSRGYEGRLRAVGLEFPFRDPELDYLPRAAIGLEDEPAVTRHLASLIRRGELGCFLDVGAFEGFYSVIVGLLDPAVEVHAFEPGSEFVPILEHNLELNRVAATVHRVVLSDAVGETRFHDRSMEAGGPEAETVACEPLDDLVRRTGIAPDAAKIDVHGSEGKVIHGMGETLRNHLRHVYLEVHPRPLLIGYDVRQLLEALTGAGFELAEMERFREAAEPRLVPLVGQAYEQFADEDRWTNYELQRRRMIYARRA